MTKINVTDERLGEFARKQHDWFERVRKGSLNPDLVEDAVQKIINTAPRGRFANEEVASNYGYPKGYAVKSLVIQIAVIMEHFGLKGSDALVYAENLPDLPEGAEGWFAVPRWQVVADTYGEAIELALEKISSTRKFYNYREGKLGKKYLREGKLSAKAMEEIAKTQKGDILIIPAQFGLKHRGKSTRRARETFIAGEFGLGAFAVGCMILTHPERLIKWEQLHIDCAGDEYPPEAGGDFSSAPIFCFCGGEVEFGARWYDIAYADYGSVSAFLSQF